MYSRLIHTIDYIINSFSVIASYYMTWCLPVGNLTVSGLALASMFHFLMCSLTISGHNVSPGLFHPLTFSRESIERLLEMSKDDMTVNLLAPY